VFMHVLGSHRLLRVEEQINRRIRDNRRISTDGTASEIAPAMERSGATILRIQPNFYFYVIRNLVDRWTKYIEKLSDYVEK
jgi:hypothetical protein